MRPWTFPFSCLASTTHLHAARLICHDIACASVARLVRVVSSAHSFQRRAMWFRNNARTFRCRRTVEPGTCTSLRMRGRRGGRKDSAPHSPKEKRKIQHPRYIDVLCCAWTEHATQLCQQRAKSHEPASLQVPCPCRAPFSSAFRFSHRRTLTAH